MRNTALWGKLLQSISPTNILEETFAYESVLHNFSLLKLWLCNFLAKEYRSKKVTHKNLVKLTTGFVVGVRVWQRILLADVMTDYERFFAIQKKISKFFLEIDIPSSPRYLWVLLRS